MNNLIPILVVGIFLFWLVLGEGQPQVFDTHTGEWITPSPTIQPGE